MLARKTAYPRKLQQVNVAGAQRIEEKLACVKNGVKSRTKSSGAQGTEFALCCTTDRIIGKHQTGE